MALLERAHDRWDAHLDLVTEDERLAELVGPVAGPEYADRTRAAYVLHMLDEFIHHGAEIALLRDLWRWQNTTVADDPRVERVIRGDPSVLDDVRATRPRPPSSSTMRPATAAGTSWSASCERGAPVQHDRPDAAAPGRRSRRARGREAAPRPRCRPGGHRSRVPATPLQWAEFLHHQDVVDFLANRLRTSSRSGTTRSPADDDDPGQRRTSGRGRSWTRTRRFVARVRAT